MLDPKQITMLRLMLDKSAGEHESNAALRAFKASLVKSSIDGHKLVDALAKPTSTGEAVTISILRAQLNPMQSTIAVLGTQLAQARHEAAAAHVRVNSVQSELYQTRIELAKAKQTQALALTPAVKRITAGETVIPFGFRRGEKLSDLNPYELRKLRSWCEVKQTHSDLVDTINEYLGEIE